MSLHRQQWQLVTGHTGTEGARALILLPTGDTQGHVPTHKSRCRQSTSCQGLTQHPYLASRFLGKGVV